MGRRPISVDPLAPRYTNEIAIPNQKGTTVQQMCIVYNKYQFIVYKKYPYLSIKLSVIKIFKEETYE